MNYSKARFFQFCKFYCLRAFSFWYVVKKSKHLKISARDLWRDENLKNHALRICRSTMATSEDGVNGLSLCWSADEQKIFFTSQVPAKAKNDAGNVKPYILTSAWNLDIDHSSTGNDSVCE